MMWPTSFAMKVITWSIIILWTLRRGHCRDEEKIMKSCFWPHEVYEPCFGGCAEVSCDNPRSHLRPCYPYCEPGCVCEEPYVRDDRTHQCVLPNNCSPTQMGIPVPTTHISSDYMGGGGDNTRRRNYYNAEELMSHQMNNMKPGMNGNKPEISRLGNYFNIVIAPPPIKAFIPKNKQEMVEQRSSS